MAIFSDLKNNFRLLDYSPSHSQLLIRSMRNKQREYNIDIIFKGVTVLLIPSTMHGLEITRFEGDYMLEEFEFENTADASIFVLKDAKGKNYFINAICFGVYHSKVDILETSIGRYDFEDLGENILWYAE